MTRALRRDLISICSSPLRVTLLLSVILSTRAMCGPPFRTDDPQPVDFRHWEFYLASAQEFDRRESQATLPHFEINYGILPNTQIHLVAPLEYIHSESGTQYGYSNTELGIKYRFLQETDRSPQIGIFPLVEIPTADKLFGETNFQAFLPVWFQKDWNHLTTYGGAGFWYNPGTGNKNWMFAGWQIQYDFSDIVTLGGELYYQTADQEGSKADAGGGFGGFINLTEADHILFSVGHNLVAQGSANGYLGFLLTI